MSKPRLWFLTLGIVFGVFALPLIAMAIDAPHTNDCYACHKSHGPSYPTLLGNLCESCHFDGGPATDVVTHSSRTTDDGYGNWDLDCWACHDVHKQQQEYWGSIYGKYIKRNLRAPIKEIDPLDPGPYYEPLSIIRTMNSDIVEFKGSSEFIDGDGEADDDICQVCHESTQYYNKLTALNSHADYGTDTQPGGVCTSCHTHIAGFQPAGGGCLDCHAQAQPSSGQYRRQVAGTGGDFERTSHHVTDGTTTEIVTAEDCEVCHDQGNHQSNSDPQVLLNDPDLGPGYSITYDNTGASIEGFCLGCHDADGSLAYDADSNPVNGYQPFSDGRDPPDIESDWSTSSHGTSTVTELTTDKCLACHGGLDSTLTESVTDHNVHGASFPSLLSELVANELVANSEEALCFACHDGSPAATDIEAMFAGTETGTSASDANLNTHHDVSDADQTYSGAVIECTDCHDPHAANASAQVVADPDPGDGVVPTPGTTWADSTFISEFCIDCHDNSFPASITPPTNPLTDIYDRWVLGGGGDKADQHGPEDASRNVLLRAGSGYSRYDILQCTDCHNAGHGDEVGGNTYPNLYNLKAIVYSKDGLTPLTPDWSIPSEDPNLVRITDTSANNTDQLTNGRAFCSTCHPAPMGGNKDKGCLSGGCHSHGASSF